jgi:hypothetical protein
VRRVEIGADEIDGCHPDTRFPANT